MRKTTLTLMATLALAIMFALSTAVAMAGLSWEDCPPASASGIAHRSDQATSIVNNVEPPNNLNADETNPGSKYGK